MELINRFSVYTSLIIITLIVLGIVWFDYQILFKEVAATSNQIVDIRKSVGYLRARTQYLPVIENERNRMLQEQSKLGQAFYSYNDPLEFLYAVEDTARRSGNTIDVTIQNSQGPNPVFRVQITSSFNELLSFLLPLGRIPATIDLNQIVLDPSADDATRIKTDLTLTPNLPL
jgi:hypothetical protein